jgi:hypothetical protein
MYVRNELPKNLPGMMTDTRYIMSMLHSCAIEISSCFKQGCRVFTLQQIR